MLLSTNLVGLLVLSLELLSRIPSTYASPSIRFSKASLHLNAPNPGNNLEPSSSPEDICPTSYNPKTDASNERRLKHEIARAKQHRVGDAASPWAPIEISVVVHSIAMNDTAAGGFLSHTNLEKSIEMLNTHFADAQVRFKLSRLDRYGNVKWFNEVAVNNPLSYEMRAQTHVGDAQTLNLWSVGYMDGRVAGYAFFPWWINEQTKNDDGIVMRYDHFVGGARESAASVLTHEVGHWVGLFHTFQGGPCDAVNDGVDDTPPQRAPSNINDSRCIPTDTCLDTPGADPINNFMDYSHSSCKTHFTPGQITRMRSVLHLNRGFPM